MKKGFTLVELLAVIIILGLLSVMIVPKVINSINESEKKANKASAENLLDAAIYKVTNSDIQGSNQNITINYTTGENIEYLDYSGKKPESGKILIKSDGKIAMAIKIGDYCYKKEENETEIVSTNYNEDTCITRIPETVTTGDGLYEAIGEQGRLVFRGLNPNNYIWLDENGDNEKANSELYRIVSYETDGTIKVVRNESLGTIFSWDESNARTGDDNSYCSSPPNGCNVWGNQFNTLYNGESLGNNFHYSHYENASATTLTNGVSGTVTEEATLNKYLNNRWLNNRNISEYIDNHKFNVNGVYYNNRFPGEDKGLKKEKEEERLYTWTGKIGLLSLTEFVESSINPNCTSVYSNYYYAKDSEGNNVRDNLIDGVWPCSVDNYNYKISYYNQWTISPRSGSSEIWTMIPNGVFGFSVPMYAEGSTNVGTTSVRPAFYLKSTIQLAGQGTSENPYYIVEN